MQCGWWCAGYRHDMLYLVGSTCSLALTLTKPEDDLPDSNVLCTWSVKQSGRQSLGMLAFPASSVVWSLYVQKVIRDLLAAVVFWSACLVCETQQPPLSRMGL